MAAQAAARATSFAPSLMACFASLPGSWGTSGRGAEGSLPGKNGARLRVPWAPWRRQAACMPAEDSVLAPVCLARRPASPAILWGRNAAGRAKETEQSSSHPGRHVAFWPPVEEVRRERVHDGHRLLRHLELALQALHHLGDVGLVRALALLAAAAGLLRGLLGLLLDRLLRHFLWAEKKAGEVLRELGKGGDTRRPRPDAD